MSKSKLLAVGLVAVAVIGVPAASALSLDALALALVALPGAVAAALLLDVRTRLRTRNRRAEAWQRATDRRIDALEQSLARLPTRGQVSTPKDVSSAAGQVTSRLTEVQDQLTATTQRLENPPARAGVPTHEDLLGTVRVLQAQYEGRLDRAQSSLDEAVRALREQLDAPSSTAE